MLIAPIIETEIISWDTCNTKALLKTRWKTRGFVSNSMHFLPAGLCHLFSSFFCYIRRKLNQSRSSPQLAFNPWMSRQLSFKLRKIRRQKSLGIHQWIKLLFDHDLWWINLRWIKSSAEYWKASNISNLAIFWFRKSDSGGFFDT